MMYRAWQNSSWRRWLSASLVAVSFFLSIGCDPGADFKRRSSVQVIEQNYQPKFLDILWMIEDRSPMKNLKQHLVAEAKEFFVDLANTTVDYRMAVTSADTEINPGLKSFENGAILTTEQGSPQQRLETFGKLIPEILNLGTSGLNQGFESALSALKGPFVPRAGVPLVVVFISYSDDSYGVSNKKSVAHYRDELLSTVNNDPSLIRVYSINYVPGGDRCAVRTNADIDKPDFGDRYFQLAFELQGDTGDLCSNFADQINLAGLRLEELQSRFLLRTVPTDLETLKVKVQGGSELVLGVDYTYDSVTNEIVFPEPPVEGTKFTISFF